MVSPRSGASMSRAADDVDEIFRNIQRIKRKEFPPAPKTEDPWRKNLPAPPAEPEPDTGDWA
jgi:hypothetical protein